MPYHAAMSNIVRALGGPAAVARLLRIKAPSVVGWGDRVPSDRCPDLERASDGRVTVEQMRPDVRWVRVPDAHWPHPAGRPCIDVAAPPPEPVQESESAA